MSTINDYKKKALDDAGYSGDINTAEWKWLKDICSPYVGTIPDMWRYALRESGFTGNSLPDMQNKMFASLSLTGTFSNKWYKYWKDNPLEGVGVGLFDLLVNGNRIIINSQALRVTKNGD